MEKVKQILQFKNDGFGIKKIAQRNGISHNIVCKYLLQLDDGLSYPRLSEFVIKVSTSFS